MDEIFIDVIENLQSDLKIALNWQKQPPEVFSKKKVFLEIS